MIEMDFKEWYTKSAYFGSAPREILEQTWAAAQEEMQSALRKQAEEMLKPFEKLYDSCEGANSLSPCAVRSKLRQGIAAAKKAAGLEE